MREIRQVKRLHRFTGLTLRDLRAWVKECPGVINIPVFPMWRRVFELDRQDKEYKVFRRLIK